MASDILTQLNAANPAAGAGGNNVFTASQEEVASRTRLAENFDTFLQLLTTQLTNQDPLSPLDAHEFTAQLVEFAAVEQQIEQSSNIRTLVNIMQSAELNSAVSYIGKQVLYEGRAFSLDEDQETVELKYELPAGTDTASVIIYDENGVTVERASLPVASGRQSVIWDGNGRIGGSEVEARLPAGTYFFRVDALDPDGEPLGQSARQFAPARVEGIEKNQDGTVTLALSSGERPDLSDIISVF